MVADPAVDEPGQALLVEVGDQLAALGPHRQHPAEVDRVEPDRRVAEDQGHRPRHRRVGEAVERLLEVRGVHVGLRGAQGELHVACVLGGVRRRDAGLGGLAVELLAGGGVGDDHLAPAEPHVAVDRQGPDVLGELVQGRGEGPAVDVHDRVEVVAAGPVVPEPPGTPAALAAGLGHRGGVVDTQARLAGVDRALLAVDAHRDRPLDPVGQTGPQGGLRVGRGAATDVDAGHRGATRHLVAGHEIEAGVRRGGQQDEPGEHQEDDLAALLLPGGQGRRLGHGRHPRRPSVAAVAAWRCRRRSGAARRRGLCSPAGPG